MLEQINNLEDDLYRLKNLDNEKIYNRIDGLIVNNKNEIAYLKSRQREQELEIKNRHENVKRLQEQKKAIRREERERQKLYNSLKSDNIGLTKINVQTNKLETLLKCCFLHGGQGTESLKFYSVPT